MQFYLDGFSPGDPDIAVPNAHADQRSDIIPELPAS